MYMLKIYHISAIVIACCSALVRGQAFPECVNKMNTFVASKTSCAKYIFCDGDNSFEGECLDDNFFNEQEGNCDDRSAVVCRSGVDGGRQDGTNVIVNNGNSNLNQNLLNQPSNQLTINNNNLNNNNFNNNNLNSMGTDISSGTPQCPSVFGVNNLIYLPNPESCSAYYTCYNGIAIPMICPRYMYYNVESRKCERQDNVFCPYDRPVRLVCNKGVYDFIPHPRNCEYYYYCSNGYLMIFQCPFDYSWHYERRTCVHRSQAKCFSNAILQEMIMG